jgi:hypothetical protein
LQKIVWISVVLLLFTSCSVFKISKTGDTGLTDIHSREEILQKLANRNLSDKGFYIQKADVEISTGEEKDKFLATWKLDSTGKSLFSIRSRTGIEVMRMFIDRDTLLINDRINRKLYYGKPEYLRRRYNLPESILPLLVGDYIGIISDRDGEAGCVNGIINLSSTIKGIKAEYVANCRNGRIVRVDLFNEFGKEEIKIIFSDFIKNSDNFIATRIRIYYFSMESEISIRIAKMEHPWNGIVDFFPGRKYELSELK